MTFLIKFRLKDGDIKDVLISEVAYRNRVWSLFTKKEQRKWDFHPIGPVKGKFARRMWEVCKKAGYVNSQDTRRPIRMLFCKGP